MGGVIHELASEISASIGPDGATDYPELDATLPRAEHPETLVGGFARARPVVKTASANRPTSPAKCQSGRLSLDNYANSAVMEGAHLPPTGR